MTVERLRHFLSNTWVQLSIVVAVGLVLRLFLATSNQVDIDEGLAYAPAVQSYLRGDWTANSEHPMVIKLIFAGSTVLFGAGGRLGTILPWLPESIGALRFVSASMGTATAVIVYYLLKELTGRHSLAMIGLIQVAFDPLSVGESSFGILDPGMTFFYMMAILFFIRYLHRSAKWNFWISGLFFGLAVGSKYFAFMGIFVGLGLLLWRRSFRANLKSAAIYLGLATGVFFAVQPYFWANALGNLWFSLSVNWTHLMLVRLVKIPGNPFLIPQTSFYGQPWPYVGKSPIAVKPEFGSSVGDLTVSPWWYMFYILIMYSTPFELISYLVAGYVVISAIRSHRIDEQLLTATLVALIPLVYFAIQTSRLPQYGILMSVSTSLLSSLSYRNLKGRQNYFLLMLLLTLHAAWTSAVLLTHTGPFTGWGFYNTPLTPILAGVFHGFWQFS